MVWWEIWSVKFFLHVSWNVSENIFCFDFIAKTVSVREQQIYFRAEIFLVVFIMKIVHQGLWQIQNTHSKVNRFIENQFCLLHGHCGKIFIKYSAMIKVWFCRAFFQRLWLLTNRIFTRLRIFSIVFPKTLLFMSLKKSFSNSFCALERRFVFNSMYGFDHAFSSKEIPRWIFVSFKPRSKNCFKFLWWRTYFFFSVTLGIRFSTLLISIRSRASGYSLYKSWSFFGYSKATSRIHPLPSWSENSLQFYKSVIHLKPLTGSGKLIAQP